MTRRTLAVLGVVALLVVGTVGAVGLVLASDGAPASSTADRTVSVSASGSASAAPDQAVVRVSVTATGDDPGAVRASLAEDAEALRATLDDLGVEYETSGYRIDEDRPREREKTSETDSTTYRGMHGFELTVDEIDRVGAVIDGAAEADAEIDGVRLTLSEDRRAELRDEAIENAMADAKTQATTIAASGNLTLTGVGSVDASMDRYRPVAYETASAGDASSGAPDTVIDSGEVSVTYTVDVTYNATA